MAGCFDVVSSSPMSYSTQSSECDDSFSDTASSSSSINNPYDIFLCHSGNDKELVRRLYRKLRRYGFTPFYEVVDSLSAPHILKTCKLGVVVLSQEFVYSNWAMVRLCKLVKAAPPIKILPLFYKISPADLSNPISLQKWHQVWEAEAKRHPPNQINIVSEWGDALELVGSLADGIFLNPSEGHADYHTQIISSIRRIMRSEDSYASTCKQDALQLTHAASDPSLSDRNKNIAGVERRGRFRKGLFPVRPEKLLVDTSFSSLYKRFHASTFSKVIAESSSNATSWDIKTGAMSQPRRTVQKSFSKLLAPRRTEDYYTLYRDNQPSSMSIQPWPQRHESPIHEIRLRANLDGISELEQNMIVGVRYQAFPQESLHFFFCTPDHMAAYVGIGVPQAKAILNHDLSISIHQLKEDEYWKLGPLVYGKPILTDRNGQVLYMDDIICTQQVLTTNEETQHTFITDQATTFSGLHGIEFDEPFQIMDETYDCKREVSWRPLLYEIALNVLSKSSIKQCNNTGNGHRSDGIGHGSSPNGLEDTLRKKLHEEEESIGNGSSQGGDGDGDGMDGRSKAGRYNALEEEEEKLKITVHPIRFSSPWVV